MEGEVGRRERGEGQGYRRRGRPKRTWRRTIEEEIRSTRRSWNKLHKE
jgi:hypothetical protein